MRPLPHGVRPGGRHDDWRPEPPRYVVTDVDGTMLGPRPQATDAVVRAVRRVRDAGIRVGFATGRMRAAVEPLWSQTEAEGPHILHNGALVRADGRDLASWPLGRASAERLLALCSEHDLYAELYVDDGYVVTDDRPEASAHWGMLHQDPAGSAHDLDLDRDEVVKATVAVFDTDPAPVVQLLTGVGLACGLATSPLAPEAAFINVTHPDADKGRALRHAADHAAVPLDAVVAIGDGANDLSMLALAGTAIAMGQAEDEVRAAAHLVVPEVDLDGAVHAFDLCLDLAGQSRPGTW